MEEEPLPEIKSEQEIREEQSEKILKFLNRSRAFEYFQKILSKDKTEKPDFISLKNFLIRINGIARDIPIHKRNTDGENVHIVGYAEAKEVLRHEDKENVLRYVYEKILSLTDIDDLKYILPALINEVHLFADGNGRTSRVMHLLLSDYSGKDEFLTETKKALGIDGRYNSLDINPSLIQSELEEEILKRHGWDFEDNRPINLGVIKYGINGTERNNDQEYNTNTGAKEVFDLYQNEPMYILTAIHMLLGDEGIKKVIGEFDMISPTKMFKTLNPADWVKILDNFYSLKKEQAELLVDIFIEPEKHKISANNSQTLKDLFIQRIHRQKS